MSEPETAEVNITCSLQNENFNYQLVLANSLPVGTVD